MNLSVLKSYNYWGVSLQKKIFLKKNVEHKACFECLGIIWPLFSSSGMCLCSSSGMCNSCHWESGNQIIFVFLGSTYNPFQTIFLIRSIIV